MKTNNCPKCNSLLDDVTAMEDGTMPEAGDITLCLYCGEILEFTKGMDLMLADVNSIVDTDFVQLQRAQQIVRAFHNKDE